VAHSETGYSGGGKKLIAEYTDPNRAECYKGAMDYALGQQHKHQPEMKYVCGLDRTPIFNPTLGDYYCGMCVSVPIFTDLMKKKLDVDGVVEYLSSFYSGSKLIKVEKYTEARLPANMLANKDNMLIAVCGNEERIFIASVFDNLGKGASGAAVECMNIVLGFNETTSLEF
jgi:N-acetyl-gamma-glutamyl-phosphate reductase